MTVFLTIPLIAFGKTIFTTVEIFKMFNSPSLKQSKVVFCNPFTPVGQRKMFCGPADNKDRTKSQLAVFCKSSIIKAQFSASVTSAAAMGVFGGAAGGALPADSHKFSTN